MPRYGSLVCALLALGAIAGCQRKFVSAPLGTPLDEVCNPANGRFTVPLDTVRFGPAALEVTKGWTTSLVTAQEVEMRRIDAELSAWRSSRWVFPVAEPRNAVRCTLTKGDTTISIQATRLNGFNYRVDVSWEPLIEGQYFYMQLRTAYVQHLRQMRGTIESVRFPADTVTARR